MFCKIKQIFLVVVPEIFGYNKNAMAKENKTKSAEKKISSLRPEVKKTVFALSFIALALILLLAGFEKAGPVGNFFYRISIRLFGWGYYLLPLTLLAAAFAILLSKGKKVIGVASFGVVLFIIAGLGVLDLLSGGSGGLVGSLVGGVENLFGWPASLVITLTLLLAGFFITLNVPLKIPSFAGKKNNVSEPEFDDWDLGAEEASEAETETAAVPAKNKEKNSIKEKTAEERIKAPEETKFPASQKIFSLKDYAAPPLNLLKSFSEKPTIGDLRANANIIKRSLEGFGIPVEMGEITVGPTVTRYTLKPAEGVKLSKITSLNSDLALALASHPIRIEAPIPGKSLVGIEVPNKAAALVRLGSLMSSPEFQKSGPLSFVLGRDIEGKPVFADIARMPHLLVAGATGSGKSVIIHSLLVSLFYKNSPDSLKLILVDPKKVELSYYENIPHLIAPVITEGKLAINALRWTIQEMEKRYQTLLEAGSRDIQSYNAKTSEPLPYLLIVIDELADLMTVYGREVEGLIIRLAQMARATGIHLIVSTQRPSVEVVTGLIKANITCRIALQVASQVDSRTILDFAGAEKLLGRGDLLFISPELSKPKRIQSSYVSEEEIQKVANFVKAHNKTESSEREEFSSSNGAKNKESIFNRLEQTDGEDDELFEQAVETVKMAKKASASLLQRRLKIGYARAARLLDIMEDKGLIGPGEGAKPREVFLTETDNGNEWEDEQMNQI